MTSLLSGSPILQDGRIVGAVIHIFVNAPAKGRVWKLFRDAPAEKNQPGDLFCLCDCDPVAQMKSFYRVLLYSDTAIC
ncbi:SpoIVB peptidase S55 domain-containing protein [Marvinbryantia formatexigens]|uniref:SpoIVB peptidase S55 domain-containing protein n=1 Tax=Marvinbryantia formatexigens TaxID=168384 RepID=UPI001F622ABF|nr:SpoIVB peptidase S55 domain-containing protein [Marvinbryantia formatexigens]